MGSNYFDFDEAPTSTIAERRMQWNEDEETLDIGLKDGVVGQVFEEDFTLIKNQTGATLLDGRAIMFAGAVGASGRLKGQYGIADGSFPSVLTIGITTQDIETGGDGRVTTRGKVRGIDTTGTPFGEVWAEEDIVYMSPTTPGWLTNVQPNAPDLQITMAVVVNVHAVNGILFVRPTWHINMSDLDDVNGTPLTVTGQLPVWDNANSYFDFNFNITDYQLKDDFTEGSVLFRGATAITEDNSNLFWDDSLNRLGIGTSSPTADLTITKNANVNFHVTATANGKQASYDLRGKTEGGTEVRVQSSAIGIGTTLRGLIGTVSNHKFELTTNDIQRLTILSNGDIGIGTTSPSEKLEVDGNVLVSVLTASMPVWTDASKVLVSKAINVDINYPISMYDAEPARGSETNWHGGILSLATGQPLDSVPTDLVVTKGIGKLLIVVNAGSDFDGDITITGTSVDRDTGATTPADTDTIAIDSLTTDGTTTDANGNTVHAFTGAYVSSKWFEGTVTLSTTNLTLTDVDVSHLSFEQNNDETDLTLTTLDANLFTTNVNAEFDAYIYTIHVTGDKCDIHNEASLHVGAVGMPALANRYERLRRGNIDDPLDGTTDGWWADLHYSNSPAYVEDMTLTVWFTKAQVAY